MLPASGAILHRHRASCIRNELLEAAKALTAAAKKQLIDSLVEDLYSSMDTPEAIKLQEISAVMSNTQLHISISNSLLREQDLITAMRELWPKPDIASEAMAQHDLPTQFPFYATQHQGEGPKSMTRAVRTELALWPQNAHPALKYILLAQLRALFSANLPDWTGMRFWTARFMKAAPGAIVRYKEGSEMKTAEILEMGATMWTLCFSNRVPFGVPLRRVPGEIIMDQHDQLLRYTPLPNLTDSSGGAMACTRTLPERTMPKADGMECAADLTEEQHRPNQSALETAPSPRH